MEQNVKRFVGGVFSGLGLTGKAVKMSVGLHALLVLLVVGGFFLVGCAPSAMDVMAGTYASSTGSLELKRDGTFYMEIEVLGMTSGVHGTYEMEGKTVLLRFEDGLALRAAHGSNTLTFSEDSVFGMFFEREWVKQ